ncbi:hypothetical protein N9188_00175 [bacterium]|nr:hypothetical protein [bacterium]
MSLGRGCAGQGPRWAGADAVPGRTLCQGGRGAMVIGPPTARASAVRSGAGLGGDSVGESRRRALRQGENPRPARPPGGHPVPMPEEEEIERNLGVQPLVEVMSRHGLKPQDLVEASTEQLTHKMVARACKGRRLTPKAKAKVGAALSAAAGEVVRASDLFNY